MDRKEIIKNAYKNGKKADGLLMACYSQEIFTRKDIEELVIDYHESLTAINTGLDHLLNRGGQGGFITLVGKNTDSKRKIYTISTVGERKLWEKYPTLSYQMACLLDRAHLLDSTKNDESFFDIFLPKANCVKIEDDIDIRDKIEDECTKIMLMLIDKNERYGNSSLQPSGIFTSVKRESKIEARIDDKLARIKNYAIKGDKHNKDYYDAIDDLVGYLILYRIALKEE